MSTNSGLAAVDEAAATITKSDHEAAVATAREEGRKAGFDAGKEDGDKAGYARGHAEGVTAGKSDGEKAGREAGAIAERERILGIEKIAMPGHEESVATFKADGKTTPAEAAMAILAVEKAKGGKVLDALKADGAAGPAAAVAAQAAVSTQVDGAKLLADTTQPIDVRCKAAWDADAGLRAEFGSLSTLVAYEAAKASGQAKIFDPTRRPRT